MCQDVDMSQESDLEFAVGYVLKRTAVALRAAMESALSPLELSVAQYACLELLGQRPAQSNAELARGAFVSRQSMNHVIRGLQERGLVTRPSSARHGRALPTQLTADGLTALAAAHDAVQEVEHTMVRGMPAEQRERLRLDLLNCTRALTDSGQARP